MTGSIDIRPEHLIIVNDILRKYLPHDAKVWVFGSRVNGSATRGSDLDLAVEGTRRISTETMASLDIVFDDSYLPYVVDIMDMKDTSHEFAQVVNSQKVPLPAVAAATTKQPKTHAANDTPE